MKVDYHFVWTRSLVLICAKTVALTSSKLNASWQGGNASFAKSQWQLCLIKHLPVTEICLRNNCSLFAAIQTCFVSGQFNVMSVIHRIKTSLTACCLVSLYFEIYF